MLIVGLTGGIGSGKSTVTALFAQHGVPIIDADLIARELTTTQKPAWQKISDYFGPTILRADQSLDRQKMREHIFSDEKKRRWLENLLHPLIIQEIQRQIQALDSAYCLVVIPLLIETGPYPFLDRILIVDVSKETQLQRLQKRDLGSLEDLQKIIATQCKRELRLAAAQDVILNNGTEADLYQQVAKLHVLYLGLSDIRHDHP